MPEIHFESHGTRGSIPRPDKEYMKYGGNTTCHSLRLAKDHIVVFDMGTGFYKMADKLVKEGFEGKIDVLLSHGHLDHIYTSIFSPAHFKPGKIKINVHGNKETLDRVRHVFDPAEGGWPLSPDPKPTPENEGFRNFLKSFIELKEITENKKIDLGGATAEAFPLSHHGGAVGYSLKVENGPKVTYLVDHQPPETGDRTGVPDTLSKEEQDKLINSSDLSIVDSHFEKTEDIKWGHGSQEYWTNEYQKTPENHTMVLTHYDPALTDEAIDEIKDKFAKRYPRLPVFATESLRLVWDSKSKKFKQE